MVRGRISPQVRRAVVVAGLALASAVVSTWRPVPDAHIERNIVKLVPPVFTTSFAQPVSHPGCTSSPQGTHGTNNAAGVLAIAMNSIALLDSGPDAILNTADDVTVSVNSSPVELNFAVLASGNVGNYVNNAPVPVGTYEFLRVVMDDQFKILCSVTCDPDGVAGPLGVGTYVTKGATVPGMAPFDAVGGPALQSNLDVTGGQGPQPFNLPLFPALAVQPNQNAQLNMPFTATGACKLYHLGGGNVQIIPDAQAAAVQQP